MRGHLPTLKGQKGLRSYFHATCALMEYFENFVNFVHIFNLTFEPFSIPQGGYDPIRPKGLLQVTLVLGCRQRAPDRVSIGHRIRDAKHTRSG